MATLWKLLSYFQIVAVIISSNIVNCKKIEGISEDKTPKRNLSVLLITLEEAGHSIPMLALGEALLEKGHKVTLLAVEVLKGNSNATMTDTKKWCEEREITFMSAGVVALDLPAKPGQKFSGGYLTGAGFIFKVASSLRELQRTMLSAIESNSNLLFSTDVAVLDLFYPSILQKWSNGINLTVISLTQTIPFYLSTIPSWYYPLFPANSVGSPNPTFIDRLKASVVSGVFSLIVNTVGQSLKDSFPIDPPSGVRNPDIAATSFGFDYPRPLYPLTHYVGPIVSKRNQPLSDNLKEWLDNHTTPYSVVYLSMGSYMPLRGNVAHAIVHGVMEAGYDLLWSLKDSYRGILDHIDDKYLNSSRILISKWLPQSTVLSHPSISMAVLHGGFGGINEALIAGVPIICIPRGGDQLMNCARVSHQGLGVDFGVVDDLTVPQVKQAIQDVKDNNCREKAKKVSRIFKAAGGASKAVELIEYYHEIGYDHLIPAWSKYNWNFIQFYNLDVYVLLAVLGYLIFCILKRIGHLWYRKRPCGRKTLKTD